jgi:metal-dependent hydrolase (beta-lactamase superfamily II)
MSAFGCEQGDCWGRMLRACRADHWPSRIAQRLLELGVVRLATAHCSGDLARAMSRKIFGTNWIEAGAELVLTLQARICFHSRV